jgi:hypothetical protein
MPTRPMLDANPSSGSAPPSRSTSPVQTQSDSPLASQLPGWDLVPAHTLLVRRRSAPANKPVIPSPASEPPRIPQASPRSTTAVASPTSVAQFCENCGARVEDGSSFCMACGTKVG